MLPRTNDCFHVDWENQHHVLTAIECTSHRTSCTLHACRPGWSANRPVQCVLESPMRKFQQADPCCGHRFSHRDTSTSSQRCQHLECQSRQSLITSSKGLLSWSPTGTASLGGKVEEVLLHACYCLGQTIG